METAKSPIAAPSPHANQERGYGVTSYFPQQQQQPPPPPPPQQEQEQQYSHHPTNGADAETLSNTLANSQTPQPDHGSHLAAPVATRPTKFTEEWDASQRGSSIMDSSAPGTSSMQRANSFSGSVVTGLTGDGITTLSRGNTLKKKASLRRSGSLKRSSSRRSMKAGSVRSLALQSTNDQDEANSAFYCPVPTAGSPTDVLANRFQGVFPLGCVCESAVFR